MNVFWSGFSAGVLSTVLPSLVFLALLLHQAPRHPPAHSGPHFGGTDAVSIVREEEVAG